MKFLSTLSAALLAVSVMPSYAEEPDAKTSKEFFKDWQLSCVEKEEEKQCSVSQALLNDQGQTVAVVNLSYVEKLTVLEFGLPLMMDLTSPVSLSVDGNSVSNYPYNACNQRACFIIREDNEDLLVAFTKGTQAQMKLTAFGGQNVEMNISLKGFSSALTELKKR